jgi:hypothetical protein
VGYSFGDRVKVNKLLFHSRFRLSQVAQKPLVHHDTRGCKKGVKELFKTARFSSEMQKSPAMLDFSASRHCINNEV